MGTCDERHPRQNVQAEQENSLSRFSVRSLFSRFHSDCRFVCYGLIVTDVFLNQPAWTWLHGLATEPRTPGTVDWTSMHLHMHQRFLTSSMLHSASALQLVRTGRALHPSHLPIIPSPELYPCPWIWAARIHRVQEIPVQAPLRLRQPGKCSLLICLLIPQRLLDSVTTNWFNWAFKLPGDWCNNHSQARSL